MSTEIILEPVFHTREHVPTRLFRVGDDCTSAIADEFISCVNACAAEGKKCVFCISTGNPIPGIFSFLVAAHKERGQSYKNVEFFDLDEYLPVVPNQLQSHARLMRDLFLSQVDIPESQQHLLNGSIPIDKAVEYCAKFEEEMKTLGGIDFCVVSPSGKGHLGFNDPAAAITTHTRMIYLSKNMRRDCASDFFGSHNVPRQALAMGPANVLSAKRLIVVCLGEGRAEIVRKIVEEPVSSSLVISNVQTHKNACVYADCSAAAGLTCLNTPWLISGDNALLHIEWGEELVRKAVIWLSLTVGKPILCLEEGDYRDNFLSSLLDTYCGRVHELNLRVHHHLRLAITGWPGGRIPGIESAVTAPLPHPTLAGYTTNYDPKLATHKRVMVFSPHPDDDVISMGATMIRLCDQGHEVHPVYETCGNIAVFDDEVLKFCKYTIDHLKSLGSAVPEAAVKACEDQLARIEAHIAKKSPENGWVDSEEMGQIKTNIRVHEALSAALFCGCLPGNVHFLNLPFYRTGHVRKSGLGDEDVRIVLECLRKVQPQQIFAAGDLSDPHGTHKMALKALLMAHEVAKKEGDEWVKNCPIYLYRGAWQEWEPEKVDMVVPISPDELYRKRLAIFRHQSQKDPAPYPGSDPREFWQRSEERNRNTARLFDKLGLTQFEAMETFVLYNPEDVLCKALLN